MIIALRFYGWLLFFLGTALFAVDLQLSWYQGRFFMRTVGNLLDMFSLKGANSYDFGLHGSAGIWRLLLQPLIETPASALCFILGVIILALFRKRTKFVNE